MIAGDTAGAVRKLALAVEDEPEDPLYRNTYGKALAAAGSTNEAIEQYRRAADLSDPKQTGYRVELARALHSADKLPEAIAEFEKVLAANPDEVESLQTLKDEVHALKPGALVTLQIQRDGRLMYVSFTFE